MTPITKIPLKTEPDAELEALKDSAATQRALDYYLKPSVTQRSTEHKVFTVREGLSLEEAMVHASELLRYALAYAHECAGSLQGAQRDLTLGAVHFIEMAKDLVDNTVDTHKIAGG